MNLLTYDHSFEGFLTAVFEVYEYKLEPVEIRKEGLPLPGMFTTIKQVFTNSDKAERVFIRLKATLGDLGLHRILYTLLTEDEDCEKHLLNVIKYALASPKQNIINDFSNVSVLKLSQYTKNVGREKHRMEAFVRFKLTSDEIYFAEIEPDFNVLPVIAKHFKDRYQDQKWIIFDNKRHYGIYYDLKSVQIIEMKYNTLLSNENGLEVFKKDEFIYQKLWKTYFERTNIKARKNTRLHVQHVPKRYWKYLIEKSVI
ncbi:MAG: DNA metabolism protein [Pedobacter sp.]|nr:MAG: DNA metabolism protein [Pedobacter sp.]